MPGLFGFIRMTRKSRIDQFNAKNTMDIMASSLCHRNDYVLESTISEIHGLGIGRISRASADRPPWPRIQDMECWAGKAFLYGVLRKDYTDTLSPARFDDLSLSAVEALRKLEGYYSLVLIQRDVQSVILGVDRKGSEPIFYLEQNGFLFFAPEVKALLAIYEGRIEPDPEAIPMFLACGHLLGDQTLVPSIKRLPGGCYLQVQENIIERKSYWSFRPGEEVAKESEKELQAELVELLKESVRRNLGALNKSIIFLSGGLDSRGILAGSLLASNNKGQLLNTVSWGIVDDIPGSDAFIAKQIAEKFHLNHTFFQRKADTYSEAFAETNYLTDGLSDVAAYHPYEFTILKSIKEMGFDRVLRGDETFGWHGKVYNYKEAEAKVGLRSIRCIPVYSKILRPRYYREWSDGGVAAMAQIKSEIKGMEPTDAKDYLYFTHRLQQYLHSCAAYKQVLFDHRNVLLDDSILAFIRRIPWPLRLHKNLYEKAVLAIYPPINAIPLAECSGLEDWGAELKRESSLQKYMKEQLSDEKNGIWEYFDKDAVKNLLHGVLSEPQFNPLSPSFSARLMKRITGHVFYLFPRQAEHFRAERFQSSMSPYQALFRLLVFKNWHETFIEGKQP